MWVLLAGGAPKVAGAQDADPPEVAIGERLFLETRFAETFARFLSEHPGATVNDALPTGDPVLDHSETTGDPLPGPFAGQSMNCRSCHLVDEQLEPGGGMRTYDDFARRSPIPVRGDGRHTTARNSPPLVKRVAAAPGRADPALRRELHRFRAAQHRRDAGRIRRDPRRRRVRGSVRAEPRRAERRARRMAARDRAAPEREGAVPAARVRFGSQPHRSRSVERGRQPGFPRTQPPLAAILCSPRKRCDAARLLDASLARFKTLGVRDPGHSAPYFHTGQFERFEEVLGFYRDVSGLARAGKLRNGDPEIARIAISDRDFAALGAFLRALNEDYEQEATD
jgi:hypothetical protein